LYTRVALRAGSILEPWHMVALRPGDGLHPNRLADLAGATLTCDLPAGTSLRLEHLELAAERRSA
jgi:sialic acid synthase SpsE